METGNQGAKILIKKEQNGGHATQCKANDVSVYAMQ